MIGGPIGADMLERAPRRARSRASPSTRAACACRWAPEGAREAGRLLGRDASARRESEVLATGMRALGANPDPLPLAEVYTPCQNGTVDGMEANLGLIATQGYYEVARNVTGTCDFWPFPTVLAMNKDAFDGLSAEQQQQLLVAEPAPLPRPRSSLRQPPQPSTSRRRSGEQRDEVRDRERRQPLATAPGGLEDGDRRAAGVDAGLHRPDPGDEGRAAARDPPPPLPTAGHGECAAGRSGHESIKLDRKGVGPAPVGRADALRARLAP